MSSLKDFLVTEVEAKALRQSSKKNAPASKYIAMAIVEAGKFTGVGGSYTPSGGGGAQTTTAANIFNQLKDLAFQGGAHIFGHGVVNGTKGMPTEVNAGESWGLAVQAAPTGEINDTFQFRYKHTFLNTPFFNYLRKNTKGRDVFLFTENTVQKIDWNEHRPIFHSIGSEVTGDNNRTISGMFSISINSKDGELVPEPGVILADLDAEELVYSFAAPSTLVNLTQNAGCAGECISFNRTAAGNCGFTADVNEAKGCGKHYLFYNDNEAFPVGVTGSVNPSTGVILFTALSAGTHRFTHAFENEVGLFGSYCFKITVSA